MLQANTFVVDYRLSKRRNNFLFNYFNYVIITALLLPEFSCFANISRWDNKESISTNIIMMMASKELEGGLLRIRCWLFPWSDFLLRLTLHRGILCRKRGWATFTWNYNLAKMKIFCNVMSSNYQKWVFTSTDATLFWVHYKEIEEMTLQNISFRLEVRFHVTVVLGRVDRNGSFNGSRISSTATSGRLNLDHVTF